MADGLTTEQLARSNPMRGFLAEVLRDERRRGNVELVGDRWRLSEAFIERYWSAFASLGSLTGPTTQRTRGEQL